MPQTLKKLTKTELARIRDLASGDRKLSAAYQLAARLAKGDAGWRSKANAVARDFVRNRRELGKAIPAAGVGSGKKDATLASFDLDDWSGRHVSARAKLLAEIPEDELEAEFDRMAKTDVIQLAPLYKISKTLRRHHREKKRRVKLTGDRFKLAVGDFDAVADQVADPETVHAIVTDPPYGKQYVPEYAKVIALAERLLVKGGALVVMTGQANLPDVFAAMASETVRYQWTLCYHTPGISTQVFGRRVKSNWKPVLWFSKGPPLAEHLSDVVTNESADRRFHEWGQAAAGMATLIERFTAEGETVLDPFVGAGATAVAAIDLKRRFLGIDLDPSCVQATSERIEKLLGEE